MSLSLKICVVGPKGAGKSAICNFLSGQSSGVQEGRLDPTAGVRILEYETTISGVGGIKGSSPVNVELWDASGDHQYESCWRAIMHEADGVLLIYNPDAPAQDQQIGDWFEFFVKKNNLKDEQCMLFAHRPSGQGQSGQKFRPPPLFQRINSALTSPMGTDIIAEKFGNFVNELQAIKDRNMSESSGQKGFRK